MKIFYIFLIILMTSCSKGTWDGKKYRPLKEEFELKGKKISDNNLLKYDFLYIQSKPSYSYSGEKIRSTYLFYPDGRLIFNTLKNDNIEELIKKCSWENAQTIGYYTIQDNKLKIERFLPYEGGTYELDYAQIHEGKLLFGRPGFFKTIYDKEFYLSLIKIDD